MNACRTVHPTLNEIRQQFEKARERWAEKDKKSWALELRGVLDLCPVYAPAMIMLGRALQVQDDIEPLAPEADPFAEIETLLRGAVEASENDVRAVIELAYFLYVLRDSLDDSRALFEKAVERARSHLEEAWLGVIKVATEQEDFTTALREGQRALGVFPESEKLKEAVEWARRMMP